MPTEHRRILVAIDGSHASDRALDEAIGLARLSHAELHIIHVLDDLSISMAFNPYAGYYTGELISQLRQDGAQLLARAAARASAAGAVVQTALYDDLGLPVRERILEIARSWPADLIVMGTHGRRGVDRALLGSCAEGVVRAASVPVLLVRAA
ncbi:universal stress protein [Achromobacter ruhlandii]|uniref:Universal stress protein n=1 Tax=Achromobacter ruhlandii TaxID=72557 RepID=A0A848NKN3_9BURK|nr:universal stress protein [Achromobacter ruhlandii]NMU91101.1 universal stress protein [Achromobacter ruhlandii]